MENAFIEFKSFWKTGSLCCVMTNWFSINFVKKYTEIELKGGVFRKYKSNQHNLY